MRRAFGIGGGTTLEQAVRDAEPTVGHMTPARWVSEGHQRCGSRILLDGRDVPVGTVAEFDDRAGWIELLEGKWKRRTRYTGRVRVIAGEEPVTPDPQAVQQHQQVYMPGAFMTSSYAHSLPQYSLPQTVMMHSAHLGSAGGSSLIRCSVCAWAFQPGTGGGQFRSVSMAGPSQWVCQRCCEDPTGVQGYDPSDLTQ